MWKFLSYINLIFLSATITQAGRDFQFVDVRGFCWQCSSSYKCQLCQNRHDALSSECLPPTEFDCMMSTNINFRYPSRDLPFYYVCLLGGGYERRQCPCDRIFDFNRQCCVFPEDLTTPIDNCIYDETNIRGPIPCGEDETTTPRPNKTLCLPPTEDDCCFMPLGHRFPSNDLTFYYVCELDSSAIIYDRIQCPCDQLFDYDSQSCVNSDELGRIICDNPTNTNPIPCNPESTTTTNLLTTTTSDLQTTTTSDLVKTEPTETTEFPTTTTSDLTTITEESTTSSTTSTSEVPTTTKTDIFPTLPTVPPITTTTSYVPTTTSEEPTTSEESTTTEVEIDIFPTLEPVTHTTTTKDEVTTTSYTPITTTTTSYTPVTTTTTSYAPVTTTTTSYAPVTTTTTSYASVTTTTTSYTPITTTTTSYTPITTTTTSYTPITTTTTSYTPVTTTTSCNGCATTTLTTTSFPPIQTTTTAPDFPTLPTNTPFPPTITPPITTTTMTTITAPILTTTTTTPNFPTLPTNTPFPTTSTSKSATTETPGSTIQAIFPTYIWTPEIITSTTTDRNGNESTTIATTTRGYPCICVPWIRCRCQFPCWWPCLNCNGSRCIGIITG
ncbi:hypothetical protein PVAND_014452 [Polypedilum vanderplanki]|uniref:Uncharacterized protein n=1 Tax=Polypedilum vanderplanki TaxID=319348 RepID=A0A9J6B9T6_POLVA|nr:hypothetical protein PVAND_014452 [Polypedilum vanderplanki]